MRDRRSLIEGLTKPTKEELEFVKGEKGPSQAPTEVTTVAAAPIAASPNRSPLSTRIRTDYAIALKRATLERQLNGIEPNTISDILDEVLGPWLKSNGHLN